MTASSYLISYITKSNFKEPKLFNILLHKINCLDLLESNEKVLGWIFYFLCGVIVVIIFEILRHFCLTEINVSNGVIFGFFGGVLELIFWKLIFINNKNKIHFIKKRFYLQFLSVHIIFGVVMILLFQFYGLFIADYAIKI